MTTKVVHTRTYDIVDILDYILAVKGVCECYIAISIAVLYVHGALC